MAITGLFSTLWPCASQMNLRDEANAKSRTLSAWNTQVFLPAGLPASAAFASAGVTISTGLVAAFDCSSRCSCAAVSTSFGFCSTPPAPTTWSLGAVMRTL